MLSDEETWQIGREVGDCFAQGNNKHSKGLEDKRVAFQKTVQNSGNGNDCFQVVGVRWSRLKVLRIKRGN